MEAITDKIIADNNFTLKAAFGVCDNSGIFPNESHRYRYQFDENNFALFIKICEEKDIKIIWKE